VGERERKRATRRVWLGQTRLNTIADAGIYISGIATLNLPPRGFRIKRQAALAFSLQLISPLAFPF
jgi:hypothetical protein